MQRSNPSSLRALIIACVLAIILLSGLYLMKRMETNRLYNTIKSSEVERRDQEDRLSNKLRDQLEKIESLSQDLGLLQSRLTRCEDGKSTASVELVEAQRKATECQGSVESLNVQKATLETSVRDLRAENIKLTGLVDTMEDEAKEADEKQDDCEAEHAECSRDLDKAENSLDLCQQTRDKTLNELQGLRAQLQALQTQTTREVVQQAVPAPREDRNPEAIESDIIQAEEAQGGQGEAREVDIEEFNELDADAEADDAVNDDEKLDEDLAEMDLDDKDLLAALEADNEENQI